MYLWKVQYDNTVYRHKMAELAALWPGVWGEM